MNNQSIDTKQYLAGILENAVDAIISIDTDGMILSLNPAAETIFGYCANELIGKNVKILMPSPYHDEHDDYLKHYLESGEKKVIGIGREVTGRHRDGSTFPIELSVSEVVVGEKRTFTGIVRDISERKNAEQELKQKTESLEQASQYLAAILENAVDAIISIEEDGTILAFNPAAETIFDYKAAELIGRNVKVLMPSPYHDEHDGYLQHYINSGEKKVIGIGREVTGRRRDGSTFPMELSVSEVVVRDKRTFTGIVRDISERKNAEQELKQKTESLEHRNSYISGILNNAVDAIISIEMDGNIRAFNPAAENIFGYQLNEVLGKNVKMLMPEPYHTEHDGYLQHYINNGEKKVIGIGREVTGRRKDGSTFPMELSISEVMVGDNRTFTGIVRDISERKNAEQEIINAKEIAESASKTKSEFLASMSHEIRTPMNGILGMAQILLDTKLNREQRNYINSIKSSGDALLNIINDILDFSKVEAGKLEIEPIPFDLKATLFEMVELLNVSAEDKGLELILFYPSKINPTVIGDPGRIRQILMNLIGNAIKFTHKGHIFIQVIHTQEDENGITIKFSIIDTGIGIAKDEQKKLFSAFSQADASTTRKYGGTGLGLTICKQLVELMGGEIGLESEAGEGSTFWFELSLPLQNTRIKALPSFPTDIGKIRVLVLDDNKVNGTIYTDYLNAWNIDSVAATDVDMARELLVNATETQKPFHIVLTDLHMPKLNGEQFAESIIKNPKVHTPKFILLTNAGTRGDSQYFTRAGFSGYLIKPIDPSVLMDTLMLLIDQLEKDVDDVNFITRHSIEESKTKKKIDYRANASDKTFRTLLAEDNLVNQKVAVKILQKLNCIVDIAANGEEALQMVKQFPYDFIFMDCHMPVMDGYQATTEIRQHLATIDSHIPIIAMTANAIKGDREKCIATGMDDYLSKPIDQKKLRDVIEKWSDETNIKDIAV